MSRFVSFLTALWLSTASAQFAFFTNLAKNVTKDVTKEVVAVADPVTKTVVFVASSQCSTVKKITNVAYEAYEGDEPDLSKLALMFITSSANFTYNLSEAATLISRSGWFNYSRPLKIYMHGFTDDPSKDSYRNISNAFLVQGDFNIVALDASSLIRWLYLRSTTMVQFIGQELAKVLANLVQGGLDPLSIHLIGHSLGSHISGFAGKKFYELTGKKVGRISGLDPAGPCFSNVNETLRLNVNDAYFVDVIHTDAGVYGLHQKIGHVDFYPNSGSQQPNCVFQTCSHSRAWLYFAESVINPHAFIGVSCADWMAFRQGKCDFNDISLMGYACKPGTTGSYYLQTNGDIPYGLGEEGLTFENNEGLVRTVGAKAGILER